MTIRAWDLAYVLPPNGFSISSSRVSRAVTGIISCRYLMPAVLSLLLGGVMVTSVNADDWPRWRGPRQTDISTEKGLLTQWPEAGPSQVWLFRNCGSGYSAPIVVGDQLFVMGSRDDKEFLLCLSVKSGKEVWAAEVGSRLKNDWGDGPRGAATFDQGHVYALGGGGDLVCVGAKDGHVEWKKQLKDFEGQVPNWGYTESPLVDGDRVVCTPGGDQGAMLALNKKTGETIWQSKDWTDGAQYSSIIAADINGIHQYIQLTQQSVVGIDAAKGTVVWRTDWPGRVAVIPTPIVQGNSVYCTAGYGVGCNLFRIDDKNEVHAEYSDDAKKVMKNHHGGVVLIDKFIYGHSDGTGWVCQDFATGEMKWREKEKFGKGSVTAFGNLLVCLSEEEGHVALVKATPEGWQEVNQFTLKPLSEIRSDRGRIWTHPVIANGHLFLRDQDLLFCFDITKK